MLVDHHCHLDFPQFAEDLGGVVGGAHAAGVGVVVTISTRIRQFERLAAIAEAHDTVFCSVGTHPHNADSELDVPLAEIVRLAQHPKVVAVGEAGLDYFYKKSTPEGQAVSQARQSRHSSRWRRTSGVRSSRSSVTSRIK